MATSPLSPITALLSPEVAKLSLDDNGYDGSFRGSIHTTKYQKNSSFAFKKKKLTMQSMQMQQDDFQLIPYYPYKNNYEKYIQSHLPILYWLPRYRFKAYFIYDLIAALTAIVMVIPQSMGYALIAGLPPIHGLYSAIFGHSLYALFGTSGQLIIAPVAIVSLMTEETLIRLPGLDDHDSESDTEQLYVAYASCLAFQVGIIALFLGIINAGVFANMLAEPVIVGFTFGAAILIAMSQMQYLFQIELEGETLIANIGSLFQEIPNIDLNSFLLAFFCIIFLLIHKFGQNYKKLQWFKFVPAALIVVIIITLISSEVDSGWDIIGDQRNGLPKFSNFFNYIDTNTFWGLWVNSLLITIIAYIETIAVATKFAEKHDYQINASQELIALGIANLIGCWFQIYPIAGVLSLAAVVESAGALTPLYTAMAGIGIIIITSLFISVFKFLPKPVLGSIVCVGILNLMDIKGIKKIWKISKKDFIVLMTTIIMTLIIGIDYGVLVGVIGSLLMFIYQSTQPEYGRIGKTKNNEYKFIKYNVNNDKTTNDDDDDIAQIRNDVLILRWDEVLFFGNSQIFKDKIKRDMIKFLDLSGGYIADWCLILCFDSINQIDFTSIDALHSLIKEIKHKHEECTLLFTNLHRNIYQSLDKANLIDLIETKHIFTSINDAEIWWDKSHSPVNNKKRQRRLSSKTQQSSIDRLNEIQIMNHTVSLPMNSLASHEEED